MNEKVDQTHKYIRDGRAPIPEYETTSRVMSANRAKNTDPEIVLRKALFDQGIRGYRLHWKKAPGRPDIAFPGRKIAIFVNGCFWHRCPICDLPLPRTNTQFWENKFMKNKERDLRKQSALEEDGWRVLVIWECEVKKDVRACVERIVALFNP